MITSIWATAISASLIGIGGTTDIQAVVEEELTEVQPEFDIIEELQEWWEEVTGGGEDDDTGDGDDEPDDGWTAR